MLIKLDTFYSAYGSYHNNPVNKLIHIFCIPTLVVTGVSMMLYLNEQFCNVDTMYSINIGSVVLGVLLSGYLLIDLLAGLVCSLFYGGLMLLINWAYYVHWVDQRDTIWPFIFYIHLAAWIGQFIGHGVFERRAPALLDNIFYAGIAPFFVILEVFILFHFVLFRYYLIQAINQMSRKVHKA